MNLDDFAPRGGTFCGVDEAGRGPVMGPIVIAGAMVEDDRPLIDIGVKDSKRLSPARRAELVEKVKKATKWEVKRATAQEIDILRQSMTMNVMEAKLFATIIEKLGAKTAYIDAADSNEEIFGRYVDKELKGRVKIISKHGADDIYPIVSAASIIAKTTRDRAMREIEQELDAEIGSGYPSDPKTINFLKEWYRENREMPPHTRKSWKTVDRIISEMGITSLDDYQ